MVDEGGGGINNNLSLSSMKNCIVRILPNV